MIANNFDNISSNITIGLLFSMFYPILIISFGQSYLKDDTKNSMAIFCYCSFISQIIFNFISSIEQPLILFPPVETLHIIKRMGEDTQDHNGILQCLIISTMIISFFYFIIATLKLGFHFRKIPVTFIVSTYILTGLLFLISPLKISDSTNFNNMTFFSISTAITFIGAFIFVKFNSVVLICLYIVLILVLTSFLKLWLSDYDHIFNFIFEKKINTNEIIFNNFLDLIPRKFEFLTLKKNFYNIFEFCFFEILNSIICLIIVIRDSTQSIDINRELINLSITQIFSFFLPVKVNISLSCFFVNSGASNNLSIYCFVSALTITMLIFQKIIHHSTIFVKYFIIQMVGILLIQKSLNILNIASYQSIIQISFLTIILFFVRHGIILSLLISLFIVFYQNKKHKKIGEVKIMENTVYLSGNINSFNYYTVFYDNNLEEFMCQHENIKIDMSDCTSIDLTASCILNTLIYEFNSKVTVLNYEHTEFRKIADAINNK